MTYLQSNREHLIWPEIGYQPNIPGPGDVYLLTAACWAVVRNRDFPNANILLSSSTVPGAPAWLWEVCDYKPMTVRMSTSARRANEKCVARELFSLPREKFSNTSFIKLTGRQYRAMQP